MSTVLKAVQEIEQRGKPLTHAPTDPALPERRRGTAWLMAGGGLAVAVVAATMLLGTMPEAPVAPPPHAAAPVTAPAPVAPVRVADAPVVAAKPAPVVAVRPAPAAAKPAPVAAPELPLAAAAAPAEVVRSSASEAAKPAPVAAPELPLAAAAAPAEVVRSSASEAVVAAAPEAPIAVAAPEPPVRGVSAPAERAAAELEAPWGRVTAPVTAPADDPPTPAGKPALRAAARRAPRVAAGRRPAPPPAAVRVEAEDFDPRPFADEDLAVRGGAAETAVTPPQRGRARSSGMPVVRVRAIAYDPDGASRSVTLGVDGRSVTLHEGQSAGGVDVQLITPDAVYVRRGGDIFAIGVER